MIHPSYTKGYDLYVAWVLRQMRMNNGGVWPKFSRLTPNEIIQWCERAKDPSWKKIL